MWVLKLHSGHTLITNQDTVVGITKDNPSIHRIPISDAQRALIVPVPTTNPTVGTLAKVGRVKLSHSAGDKSAQTPLFSNIGEEHKKYLFEANPDFIKGYVRKRLKTANIDNSIRRIALLETTLTLHASLTKHFFEQQGIPTKIIEFSDNNFRVVAKTAACVQYALKEGLQIASLSEYVKRAKFWLNGYQSPDTVTSINIKKLLQLSPVWYRVHSVKYEERPETSEYPSATTLRLCI